MEIRAAWMSHCAQAVCLGTLLMPTGESGGPLIQARPFNVTEAYSDRFVLSNITINYDLGWGSVLSTSS